MELGTLLADDDAVSPVIGGGLMVGITVALAAVVATFVLGVNTTTEVPDVEFRYDAEDGSTDGWGDGADGAERFEIHHDGGEPVETDRVTVQYAGTPVGSISWLSVSGRTPILAPAVTSGATSRCSSSGRRGAGRRRSSRTATSPDCPR